jgi:hypothetical protein
MSGAAGEVHSGEFAAAVGGLEGSLKEPVAGDAVDCAVENAVAVVDILRGQRSFEDDAVFDVGEPAVRLSLSRMTWR